MTHTIESRRFIEKGLDMFQFLSWSDCQILLTELQHHPFRDAPPVKGSNILQDFREADLSVAEYPKTAARITELESLLRENLIMPIKHSFNSFRLQRYAQGSTGISPHADSTRFMDPIAVIVLRDGGDFCIHASKDDENPFVVPATVGSVIVLTNDIIHSVQNIAQEERYTLTVRIDTTPHVPL